MHSRGQESWVLRNGEKGYMGSSLGATQSHVRMRIQVLIVQVGFMFFVTPEINGDAGLAAVNIIPGRFHQ